MKIGLSKEKTGSKGSELFKITTSYQRTKYKIDICVVETIMLVWFSMNSVVCSNSKFIWASLRDNETIHLV